MPDKPISWVDAVSAAATGTFETPPAGRIVQISFAYADGTIKVVDIPAPDDSDD